MTNLKFSPYFTFTGLNVRRSCCKSMLAVCKEIQDILAMETGFFFPRGTPFCRNAFLGVCVSKSIHGCQKTISEHKHGASVLNTFFFFFNLFLAVLGFRFCARAFSSCGKWGPLLITVRGPLLLRSTGSRRAGSVVVAYGPSCSAACGILPDQGSNPCPLHWQADSQPLRHPGSPGISFKHKFDDLYQFRQVPEHYPSVARLISKSFLLSCGGDIRLSFK